MTIGIDISQLAYPNTGVSNYLYNLVLKLLEIDKKNEYVLFFSSLRRDIKNQIFEIKNINQKVKIKHFKIPLLLLDLIWNKLHIFPVEKFIGEVDIFITSDWTEPPVIKAKKATILYDLIVYKYPRETAGKIVDVQKRKLKWTKNESYKIFCISRSAMADAAEILGIERNKLEVIYPGL